jgi:hypothetical protein
VHETEYLGPDLVSTFVRLTWECLNCGVLLDIVQHPFPKPDIYRHLKGDLTLKQICANLMTKKRNRLKKLGKQETLCSLPFEDYESMTSTQQFSFEKAIETERRWSNFNLEVCHICQGCHLGTMKRTTVELGHSGERQTMPICDSCADNHIKNISENRVIPYWIDKHGSRNVDVPQELRDMTFAEKQLIDLASAHMSLIHLKNGTLASRGHCVTVEQKKSELFLVLPRKPGDLDFLNVIRSGRSSDQEVYESIFKVRRQKVLDALYCLVEHNVLYKEYGVTIDPINLDFMVNEEVCTLPLNHSIETSEDNTPEDDDMGPSPDQTLMEELDKLEEMDLEVSGKRL